MTPHINCERRLNDWLLGFYLIRSPFATAKFPLHCVPRPFCQAPGRRKLPRISCSSDNPRHPSPDFPMTRCRAASADSERHPIGRSAFRGTTHPRGIFSYVWQIKDSISNEFGRVSRWFLRFGTDARCSPVRVLQRVALEGAGSVFTMSSGQFWLSSFRCYPANSSSVMNDQEEFCELPAFPGGGSRNQRHGHVVAGAESLAGIGRGAVFGCSPPLVGPWPSGLRRRIHDPHERV
jgi:hypothetical protein